MYQKLIDDLEHDIIGESIFDCDFDDYSPTLKKFMKSRGYRFLGSGLDRMVFHKPKTKYVLKIDGSGAQNRDEFRAYSICETRWSSVSMELIAKVHAISNRGSVLAQEYVSMGLGHLVISKEFNSLIEDTLPHITGFKDMSYTNVRYSPNTRQIKVTDLGLCREGTIRTISDNIAFKKRKDGWFYLTKGRKILGKCNSNIKEIKKELWGEEAAD